MSVSNPTYELREEARADAEQPRVLVISPVHNEAEHIEEVARSVAAQTRPPELWLVVDDASTDATPEKLRALAAELPFMRVLTTPPGHTAANGDRLAAAAVEHAYN